MRKLISLTALLTLFTFTGLLELKLYAQEKEPAKSPKIGFDIPVEERFPAVKTLKEVMEIRKKMKEIERQTIENDPELKASFEQIMNLKNQLREKLNEKLKDNEE